MAQAAAEQLPIEKLPGENWSEFYARRAAAATQRTAQYSSVVLTN